MSRSILNKNKYRQFADRCRDSNKTSIQVSRIQKKKQVILRYSASGLRAGRRANGEWTISRVKKTPEQIEQEVETALEMMASDFIVKKGTGFKTPDQAEESTTPEASAEAEATESE